MARNQVGQLPHIVEDHGRAGILQLLAISFPAMAAAVKAEHGHPAATAPAMPATLSSITRQCSGARLHPFGGEQKQIRRRLAMARPARRKNMRREPVVQTGAIEAGADFLRRPARCDADGLRNLRQGLANMRRGFQRSRKQSENLGVCLGLESRRAGCGRARLRPRSSPDASNDRETVPAPVPT